MDSETPVNSDTLPPGVDLIEAGHLQEGQVCPCCQSSIERCAAVGRCPRCGHLQHAACWTSVQRCCSYQCEPSTARPPGDLQPQIVVSPADIERVVGAAPRVSTNETSSPLNIEPKPLSRLAIASFACGLAGALLLGIPGLVAVGLGAAALGPTAFKRRLRGGSLAVAGIILGIVDVIGWSIAGVVLLGPHSDLQTSQGAFQPIGTSLLVEDLSNTPAQIRRAIRANVLVVARQGRSAWEGSGVVLQRRDDRVFIVTNRHVIEGGGDHEPISIDITFVDGHQREARLIWSGDGGVDLAVMSCEDVGGAAEVALLPHDSSFAIGHPVFAIGNPFGLGWSYCTGVISAVRQQTWSGQKLRVIQTQTPLNPGNSGGGLYDTDGRLIGINTMNTDKNRTEGIGFAIAFADMVPVLTLEAGLTLQTSPEERP